jgi:pimeloyl-ACP methyl ester carboxylesterase
MRTFRKVMLWALAAGVVSFLVVPFLIPFESTGTQTNVEAAGPNAEFVTLAGVDVHVVTQPYTGAVAASEAVATAPAAQKPPLIILLHGFGASTFSWRDVLKSLGAAGEVIAYDRPGFGFTERPTNWGEVNPYGAAGNFAILDELISTHGQGRDVVLVGHSAGGELAAEYARLNPDTVQRLVLADPAILTTGGSPAGLSWIFQIPQVNKLGPILVGGIASAGDDLLRQSYVDQSKITQAVLDGYHQPLTISGWEQAFWEFTKAPRVADLATNVVQVSQPTLLISGDSDTVVPVADTKKLATMIPDASLVLIAGAAHLPQEEQPAEFAQAVVDWLAQR